MTGEMFLAYVRKTFLVPDAPTQRHRRDGSLAGSICQGTGIGRAILKQWARHCVTCRNISPDLQSHSRCLPANSRHSCVKWQREPSQALTAPSTPSSHAQSSRMCQLFQACRLCFNMIGIFSDGNGSRGVRSGVITNVTIHQIMAVAPLPSNKQKAPLNIQYTIVSGLRCGNSGLWSNRTLRNARLPDVVAFEPD